ncbi:glycosyltransferase family 4 protein [Helicobacter felis]|uniref:glycosyltransferase family 4 protein n=1 Tax=Helicobacter felis TaxID=214 RepID=UPI000CEEB0AA|nr:glycosyltransferase family 4 protein [Helicobacter felis]
MRILFCTSQYYPLQSGRAIVAHNLSLALARAGHTVLVCTANVFDLQTLQWEGQKHAITSGNTAREVVEIAPNLFVIGFHIYVEGYLIKGEIAAYKDFVAHFECDLLLCSGVNEGIYGICWTCDLLYDLLPTLEVKKALKIHESPNIRQGHSWKSRIKEVLKIILSKFFNEDKKYFRWIEGMLRNHLKDFDCVFFLDEKTHNYHTLAPFCSRISILPHGVFEIYPPKTLHTPLKKTNDNDLETLMQGSYLLSVSNYHPAKNHDKILQAYYLSQVQIPLVFVGFCNYVHALGMLKTLKQDLDDQYGFKPVLFLHSLERPQILALFTHATLFLHAAPHPCYPMAILESMQYGLPFVCMDVGCVKQLYADLVVQTPQEMAHKVDSLLSDPDHYYQVAKNLHTAIQNYTYDKIIPKFLETLNANGHSA